MGKGPQRWEDKNPEALEELMKKYTDPTDKTSKKKLAIEFNIGPQTLDKVLKRNSDKLPEVKRKVVKTWEDLIPTLTKLSNAAFDHSLATLHELNAYQAALVGGIALDKKLAVENNGQININVLHEHRHELDKIGQALMGELQRRKLLDVPKTEDYIDVDAQTISVDDARDYITGKGDHPENSPPSHF